MIGVYIVILCLSTAFGAWIFIIGSLRLNKLVGLAPRFILPGLFALCAVLAFWMVASAPAFLLVAAFVLLAAQTQRAKDRVPATARWALPLVLCLLVGSTLTFPTIILPQHHIPAMLLAFIGALCWSGFTFSGRWMADPLPLGTLTIGATILPLLAGPVLLHAPTWIALDCALLLSGLFGALLLDIPEAEFGIARLPLAFLTGWLVLESASHGAWLPALVSLGIWAACVTTAIIRESIGPDDALPF